MKMISEGKLKRYRRKGSHTVQSQLFQVWEKYKSNQVSAHHLLKKRGAIYGPGCILYIVHSNVKYVVLFVKYSALS
jgi:hypothetical protein